MRSSTPRRALRDAAGAVAVEFALIVPVIVTLIIGLVSSVQLIRADIVFSEAVSGLADVTAHQALVTGGPAGTLGDFCKGAQLTMFGYGPSSLSMAIASVTNSSGSVGMDWESDNDCPTTAAAMGSAVAVSLGTALVPNSGDSLIIVKASYTYTPLFSLITGKPVTFSQVAYERPRTYNVACSSGC